MFGLPRGYLQSQEEGTKNQEGTSRWIPAVKGTQMMAKVCKNIDPRIAQKKDPLMMTTTHVRPDHDHPRTLLMPDLTEGNSSVLLTTDRSWTCRSEHSIICSSSDVVGSSRSEKTHSDPCDSGIQVAGTYLQRGTSQQHKGKRDEVGTSLRNFNNNNNTNTTNNTTNTTTTTNFTNTNTNTNITTNNTTYTTNNNTSSQEGL
ncbi:hypothetical protein Pmani_037555 [Petrolisthes manimaculis]|uniref:Uncharacterized protein n=1 Tax=Petrolisthes manimaculis TaxID=1843537 RepID=A0AAE1TL09_9EUCA|nr:hypothetical protein Pmani_037555 [Petrolisthes manimaculis]